MSGNLGVTYITKEDRVKGNTLRREGKSGLRASGRAVGQKAGSLRLHSGQALEAALLGTTSPGWRTSLS